MKQRIAFALIMGMITTAIISFTLITINVGFSDSFLTTWLRSWFISWVLAVTSILTIGPYVQVFVGYLLNSNLFTKQSKQS